MELTTRAPRVPRWKWLAVVALGAAAVASNVYLTERDFDRSMPGMGSAIAGDNRPHYPERWEKSLERVRELVSFPVRVPDHPDANRNTLMASYQWANVVELAFEPPDPLLIRRDDP